MVLSERGSRSTIDPGRNRLRTASSNRYEMDGEDLAEHPPPARGRSLGCGATKQILETGGKLTKVVVHVGLER